MLQTTTFRPLNTGWNLLGSVPAARGALGTAAPAVSDQMSSSVEMPSLGLMPKLRSHVVALTDDQPSAKPVTDESINQLIAKQSGGRGARLGEETAHGYLLA